MQPPRLPPHSKAVAGKQQQKLLPQEEVGGVLAASRVCNATLEGMLPCASVSLSAQHQQQQYQQQQMHVRGGGPFVPGGGAQQQQQLLLHHHGTVSSIGGGQGAPGAASTPIPSPHPSVAVVSPVSAGGGPPADPAEAPSGPSPPPQPSGSNGTSLRGAPLDLACP
ncbi:hypothetical protein cyc_08864 [Cyclospora cayetanensis]|uniref:Uncharacterized protein n=1 Tax=Cyclospora cayetanensis TaxID=88456 RepID=A0A1D3DB75_9EIME|nr:hypothetical protein cyc_08864 [Cyclospora cayetanensis]